MGGATADDGLRGRGGSDPCAMQPVIRTREAPPAAAPARFAPRARCVVPLPVPSRAATEVKRARVRAEVRGEAEADGPVAIGSEWID